MQRQLLQYDIKLFRAIFHLPFAKPVLGQIFLLLTRSADGPVYVGIFIAGFLLNRNFFVQKIPAISVAFGIQILIYKVVKSATRRERPFCSLPEVRWRIWPPDRFSFPSGHTAGAFLVANLVGTWMPELTSLLLIWATGVGLSRIYLGVHYPSDVLAGALLGFFSAKMTLGVF